MPRNRLLRLIVLAALLLVTAATGAAPVPAQRLDAPPYRIHYTRPADESIARRTLVHLQETAAAAAARLPLGDAPVDVVICATFAEFRQVAGAYAYAPVGGIARGDEGHIILKAPYMMSPHDDYAGTVRHELLHVLIARNTDPAHVPRWFNEGIAMMLSREIRWEGTFEVARMYMNRAIIPYWRLDAAFSPRGQEAEFSNAYAQAYSMIAWLRDRMGEDAFWQLVGALKHTPFETALPQQAGLTEGQLFQQWQRSLWKIALIFSLVTGLSLFQIAALLVLAVWWRKYRHGRRVLDQWREEEEGEGDESAENTYVEGAYLDDEPYREPEYEDEEDCPRW